MDLLEVNVWCYMQFEMPCSSDLYEVEDTYCPGLLP